MNEWSETYDLYVVTMRPCEEGYDVFVTPRLEWLKGWAEKRAAQGMGGHGEAEQLNLANLSLSPPSCALREELGALTITEPVSEKRCASGVPGLDMLHFSVSPSSEHSGRDVWNAVLRGMNLATAPSLGVHRRGDDVLCAFQKLKEWSESQRKLPIRHYLPGIASRIANETCERMISSVKDSGHPELAHIFTNPAVKSMIEQTVKVTLKAQEALLLRPHSDYANEKTLYDDTIIMVHVANYLRTLPRMREWIDDRRALVWNEIETATIKTLDDFYESADRGMQRH